MKKIILICALFMANLMADGIASLAVLADSKDSKKVDSGFDFASAKRLKCDDKRIFAKVEKGFYSYFNAMMSNSGLNSSDFFEIEIKNTNDKTLNPELGLCGANIQTKLTIKFKGFEDKFGEKLDEKERARLLEALAAQFQIALDNLKEAKITTKGDSVIYSQEFIYSGFVDKNDEILTLNGEQLF